MSDQSLIWWPILVFKYKSIIYIHCYDRNRPNPNHKQYDAFLKNQRLIQLQIKKYKMNITLNAIIDPWLIWLKWK